MLEFGASYIRDFTVLIIELIGSKDTECNFRQVIFKQTLDGWGISCDIVLKLTSKHLWDKSTLAQVMAWCCQAASHYLTQSWPRSMSPYGITSLQWVNLPDQQDKCATLPTERCPEWTLAEQCSLFSWTLKTKLNIPGSQIVQLQLLFNQIKMYINLLNTFFF